MHSRVFGGRIIPACVFLVPVENPADERRNERDARFRACDGLMQAEEQRQIAVNALFFEHFAGANAFPCGRDLDQNAITGDSGAVVLVNDLAAFGDGGLGVEG